MHHSLSTIVIHPSLLSMMIIIIMYVYPSPNLICHSSSSPYILVTIMPIHHLHLSPLLMVSIHHYHHSSLPLIPIVIPHHSLLSIIIHHGLSLVISIQFIISIYHLFSPAITHYHSSSLIVIRDLKIYDAAARRRGFITKDIFIEDNSHE